MEQRTVEPCVVVLFGASGDLAWRKLVPSLFELDQQGRLPAGLRVLGISRTAMSDGQWREKLAEQTGLGVRGASWQRFADRLAYLSADATKLESYEALGQRLVELGGRRDRADALGTPVLMPNLLFYLSVAPELYEPIVECIGQSGLVSEGRRWCSLDPSAMPWQRIIVEKPFGRDLASAVSLNKGLGRVFEEEAIFRIDHYLGKELVQNLAALRFGNSIFEPLWNGRHVDHVQVTAAETIGVGRRAGTFYDTSGALRDMVQSHLLQVLALVAMEPPSVFSADAMMRERIKLLNSVRAIGPGQAVVEAALGRYGLDASSGEPAYVDTPGVRPELATETFAAMRLEIENWRWAGVPFYLRSGKRLAQKRTEIVVQFRPPPLDLFRGHNGGLREIVPNRLVIRIAPREGIDLTLCGKVPGASFRLASAELGLDYADRFGGESMEAYGPLLLDAMRGDRTLYKHRDEVELAWRICQPILDSAELRAAIETYEPGTWGPTASDRVLARDGRKWHNGPSTISALEALSPAAHVRSR